MWPPLVLKIIWNALSVVPSKLRQDTSVHTLPTSFKNRPPNKLITQENSNFIKSKTTFVIFIKIKEGEDNGIFLHFPTQILKK